MEKTTMSVQELSAQMGISLPKAYELVKTPGFPTIRIGARILIPIEAYKELQVLRSGLHSFPHRHENFRVLWVNP